MNTQTQSDDGIVLCQPKLLQYLQYALQYHEIKNQSVKIFILLQLWLHFSDYETLLGIYAHILGEWINCVRGYHSYHMSRGLHIFKLKEVIRLLSVFHLFPKQVTVRMNRTQTRHICIYNNIASDIINQLSNLKLINFLLVFYNVKITIITLMKQKKILNFLLFQSLKNMTSMRVEIN